jgi:dolichol-phosphate mannosyltransferase
MARAAVLMKVGALVMDDKVRVSVIVPVYNEAQNLNPLFQAVAAQLKTIGLSFEIIFVDDGSRDDSLGVLRALANQNDQVKVVSLSRNFGHQAAITAGMEHASGAAVIVMDADLQHPPELLPQMIAAWQAGAQVVYTCREDNEETSWFKRFTSAAFYRFINLICDISIVPSAADFRLLDRVAVDALLRMPERSRFVRGLVSWLGFRQVGLQYRANPRLHGKSKYSLRRMVSLGLEGVVSFSTMPLRVAAFIGLGSALLGMPYAAWAIYARLFTDTAVPGWASLLVAVLFLGGVQLMSIGVIGEYIGRIYKEVKGRPIYLTGELIGFGKMAHGDVSARPSSNVIPVPHFLHTTLVHDEISYP